MMLRILMLSAFGGISAWVSAQNYNPFVAQGIISPSPLFDLASNGSGHATFIIGNSGDDPMPLVANQEMQVIITLSRGVPNTTDPLLSVGGSFASYFNWVYDAVSKSFLGIQNQTIAGALSGGTGNITIKYKVTSNSIFSNPQNGFNVNITPPAYTNGSNSMNDDQVSSYTWTEPKFVPVPDFGVTPTNLSLAGNLKTNDDVPVGTTYGSAVAVAGNPSSCLPTISSAGTYTFLCATPGEYNFNVQVCRPTPALCVNMPLTITVLNTSLTSNPPIANSDFASTRKDQSVTVHVMANDQCQNGLACNLSNPIILLGPTVAGASASVQANGSIVYTPATGFFGKDSIRYRVCDNQTPVKCDDEWLYISVLPEGYPNITLAADDYMQTITGIAITRNLKINDLDPEGDGQLVTAQSTTVPGKGVFVLNTNGMYTFTPDPGFTGVVDFPYTICDNVTPASCATATLHILVSSLAISLPVTLHDFSAEKNNCTVKLQWSTLTENNSHHFNVLRKRTDEGTFFSVAQIEAAGSSDNERTYHYTDHGPFDNSLYEYKIESVDIDESTQFSKSVLIAMDCSQTISLFPNPFHDQFVVKLNSRHNAVCTIKVIDMKGSVVVERISSVDRGLNLIQFDGSQITPGLYQVMIDEGGKRQVLKLHKLP